MILPIFLVCLLAVSAAADVVLLENGKKLQVQSYVIYGESIYLTINDRSEVVIPVSWIREIRATQPRETAPAQAGEDAPEFVYSEMILALSRRHSVDWRLVAAVMEVESNFNPQAVSPKGALGLMQLMPETAQIYRVRNPYDPRQNIEAGIRHLKMLMKRYKGKMDLVLAAYNSGERTVDRYGGIPPFQETRDYVRKVLQLYRQMT